MGRIVFRELELESNNVFLSLGALYSSNAHDGKKE
jgi:hypothetical protein